MKASYEEAKENYAIASKRFCELLRAPKPRNESEIDKCAEATESNPRTFMFNYMKTEGHDHEFVKFMLMDIGESCYESALRYACEYNCKTCIDVFLNHMTVTKEMIRRVLQRAIDVKSNEKRQIFIHLLNRFTDIYDIALPVLVPTSWNSKEISSTNVLEFERNAGTKVLGF